MNAQIAQISQIPWSAWVLLGLVALFLLRRPLKWLLKLIARSGIGLAFLFFWGKSGLLSSLALGTNLFNALTLGLLGIPGFGLLMLFRWMSLT